MWMGLDSEGIDSLLIILWESATWRRQRKRECGLNHDSTLYENLHYLKWMAADFVNTLINGNFQLAFLIKVWKKVQFKPSSAKFGKFLRYAEPRTRLKVQFSIPARPWTELWFRTELWQPYALSLNVQVGLLKLMHFSDTIWHCIIRWLSYSILSLVMFSQLFCGVTIPYPTMIGFWMSWLY